MNKFIKRFISIISISLISVFALTGCPRHMSNNVTEFKSGEMTINLDEGYKFVDIKIALDTRKSGVENLYVYTLTKKRKASEKPETYKLDMMYSNDGHLSRPRLCHITIIEN